MTAPRGWEPVCDGVRFELSEDGTQVELRATVAERPDSPGVLIASMAAVTALRKALLLEATARAALATARRAGPQRPERVKGHLRLIHGGAS